jgi:hypothetical protein
MSVEQLAESNDDEFNAGFESEMIPTATPEPQAQNPAPAADAEPVVAAPKFAQITEEQLESLLKSAAQIDEIKATSNSKLDKAFGKIGSIERLMQELQSSTPAGQAVEVSPEDFSELSEEYPELANLQMKGLNRVLAKVRGTGPTIDQAQIETLVQQRLAPALENVNTTVERQVGAILLAEKHENWREIVGKQDDKTNAFRVWLELQPEAYRNQINQTNQAGVIAKAIDTFKAVQAKKPAIDKRTGRIEAAVTPKGVGGHALAPSDDDEFNAGFQGR